MKHKGFVLIPILLVVFIVSFGYLGYQIYKSVPFQAEMPPKEEATDRPDDVISNAEKTSQQKSFTNNKYGYSFAYPDYGTTHYYGELLLSEELVEIGGIDSVILKIEPIETKETNPLTWWKKQSTEPYYDKQSSCFSSKLVTEIKSFYEPTQLLVKFNKSALQLELKDTEGCSDPSYFMVIVPNRGYLLRMVYDAASSSEAILKSLKFF